MVSRIPGLVFRWVLFVSSYIPIFIMIFLSNLKKFTLSEFQKTWRLNPIFWWVLIILTIVSLLILIFWLSLLKRQARLKNRSIKVDNYVLKDSDVLNYFVTYIIPILSLKPESLPSIIMNLILIIIEGIYFVGNNAVYYNVMLIAAGYHIYSFGDGNIIITRLSKQDLIFEKKDAKQIGTTNIYYI